MQTPKEILANNAGAVLSRKCRATKTIITLYSSVESGLENDPEGKWSTVCETHGAIVSHRSQAHARSAMSFPDWCEECQAILNDKEIAAKEGL